MTSGEAHLEGICGYLSPAVKGFWMLIVSLNELTYDISKSMTWRAESQQGSGAPMLWGLLPTHILVSIWCLLYFSLNKLQFWSLELQTMNTSRRCFLELGEVDSGAVFKDSLSPNPMAVSSSGCPQAGTAKYIWWMSFPGFWDHIKQNLGTKITEEWA